MRSLETGNDELLEPFWIKTGRELYDVNCWSADIQSRDHPADLNSRTIHAMILHRRTALAGIASLLTGGCSLPTSVELPAALRPQPLPVDGAAVFHAFLRGQPVTPLSAPDSAWQVGVEAPASVAASADGLSIVSLPERRAWASPRLPLAPLGSTQPLGIEELAWEASLTIAPEQRYFILCELRFAGEPDALFIQPTPFDIQIMLDTARAGGGTSTSLSRRIADGSAHAWRLRSTPEQFELWLDGSRIWSMAGNRALSRVAFGETRTDAEHGGMVQLRDIVYVRRPA